MKKGRLIIICIAIIVLMLFGLKFTSSSGVTEYNDRITTSSLSLCGFVIGDSIDLISAQSGRFLTTAAGSSGMPPRLLKVLAVNKYKFILATLIVGFIMYMSAKKRP